MIRKTSAKITFLDNARRCDAAKHIRSPCQAVPGNEALLLSLSLRAAIAAARVGRPTNSRGAA